MNRYGAPTTYKRITPNRGCGFILKRIYELSAHPRKIDVYLSTPWYKRPGFASLLWGAMIRDGLIESDDGLQAYEPYRGYFHRSGKYHMHRAAGHYEQGRGYTVRYHLTDKGRRVYEEMMARVNTIREEKKAFCERNGIEFGTGKTVAAPKKEEWREDDFLEPGETKEEWMARNGVTPPPTPVERDILEKEAVDCAKLAADYAGENQKLRAEKDDLNARLKKLADRLVNLETEIAATRNELDSLINWDK